MATNSTRGRQGFRHSVLANGGMIALLALWLNCVRADTVRGVAQFTQWNKVNIHGHKIYYAVRGSGPTLVFLHGGGDSALLRAAT